MNLCYSLMPFSFPFFTFTPSNHPISFLRKHACTNRCTESTVWCVFLYFSQSLRDKIHCLTPFECRYILWRSSSFLFLSFSRLFWQNIYSKLKIYVLYACTEWYAKMQLILGIFFLFLYDGNPKSTKCSQPANRGKTIIRSKTIIIVCIFQ